MGILELLTSPEAWVSLLTLTALEIVLGIDNIVFISILVGKLPENRRALGYRLGLGLAMVMRILLLLAISWVMGLTRPLFSVLDHAVSGRDLVLILGGLFLVAKATFEIHEKLEGEEPHETAERAVVTFGAVITQIVLLDAVFSLDSVITAVGLAQHVPVMVLAIVIAVLVMMWAARPISDFVDAHPTIKVLALSFLVLIGVALIGEGLDFHIPKGYIYFAMAYALVVEMLNMKMRKARAPLELHKKAPD